MSRFKEFKEKFDKVYENVYDFMDEWENGDDTKMYYSLVENADNVSHDSMGYENSTLKRIFKFHNFDVTVLFEGTRCSYVGEEWEGFREAKQITKTITEWE